LAGAVVITTKKTKNKTGGSISVEAGSYDSKDLKGSFYQNTDKYSFNLNANYTYTDGYWDQTENDTKSVNGKFQYYIDDTSDLTLGIDVTSKYEESGRGSVTGVTAAETNPTGEDGDWAWNHDYDTDLNKYFLTYSKDFANQSNLKVSTYYYKDLYHYQSNPYDEDDDGNDDFYCKENDEDIKQYGIKTEYRGETTNMAYMIGFDIGKRESEDYSINTHDYVDSRGYDQYEGEWEDELLTEHNYAIYGETKYRFTDRFTTTLNLRYDVNEYEYSENSYGKKYDRTTHTSSWRYDSFEAEETFENLTYRVGMAYNTSTNKTIYTNISTGFRNPRIQELYNGELGWGDAANNFDLDTETSITYEIGIRGTTPFGATCEASVFVTDTKDIISKVAGTYNWSDSDFYDNVGDARSRGIELSMKGSITDTLSYNLSYTYLDAYYTAHDPFVVDIYADNYTKNRDGSFSPGPDGSDDDNGENLTYDITGNQLPRTPHHKIDLILNYRPNSKWNFMAEFYAQSSYYGDETNLVEFDGYGKLNLKATYKPTENLEFFAKIDNVFDNQYYRSVYLFSDRDEDGDMDAEDASITVDPGRMIYVGMKYRF